MRLTCNEDIGSSILSGGTKMKYNCLHCLAECIFDRRRKANKYCSNKCQKDFQTTERVKTWLETGETGRTCDTTPKWLKDFILKEQDYKCFECKISDWNGKSITLDLEHIDGNSKNNNRQNLCCLCPNCHSQTSTYKAKNKGNGRKSRIWQN